jgi:hypothetical protein
MHRMTIALLASSLTAACGGAGNRPATGADVQRVGMASPASVYCRELGGTLVKRSEEGGDAHYCNLPDGSVIEEWQLYRDNAQL